MRVEDDRSPALVTGAAKGIGAAVAAVLAAEGRPVAVVDRDDDTVSDLAAKLTAEGHHVHAVAADVADADAVEAAVASAEGALGPLGVLVNNAGVLPLGALLDIDPADWARSFAVNTDGVFHMSRAVGRRMRDRGRGSIVTVASNAAGVPRAGMGAYGSAKAAAMMLTRCLGLELAPHGVRANVVCPGSTDTPMLRGMFAGDADEGIAGLVAGSPETFKVGIPLGRVADPADVADAVAYLASPRARHITMQALYVDGGATLRA
ncbi:MAG: 2,3-dihydro-2,3-dihydroxybenzoate dehydrogenase [Pseudonocardia sp. SCN 72-86]|nr:MAG: 2,3-dihydro-2,3-dihydroxybenzoate dehydrogenase [Pseudonocardia sp. SCN 72-86]